MERTAGRGSRRLRWGDNQQVTFASPWDISVLESPLTVSRVAAHGASSSRSRRLEFPVTVPRVAGSSVVSVLTLASHVGRSLRCRLQQTVWRGGGSGACRLCQPCLGTLMAVRLSGAGPMDGPPRSARMHGQPAASVGRLWLRLVYFHMVIGSESGEVF